MIQKKEICLLSLLHGSSDLAITISKQKEKQTPNIFLQSQQDSISKNQKDSSHPIRHSKEIPVVKTKREKEKGKVVHVILKIIFIWFSHLFFKVYEKDEYLILWCSEKRECESPTAFFSFSLFLLFFPRTFWSLFHSWLFLPHPHQLKFTISFFLSWDQTQKKPEKKKQQQKKRERKRKRKRCSSHSSHHTAIPTRSQRQWEHHLLLLQHAQNILQPILDHLNQLVFLWIIALLLFRHRLSRFQSMQGVLPLLDLCQGKKEKEKEKEFQKFWIYWYK